MDIPLILLAAGAASRMRGVDKLMQPVDGLPLIARHLPLAGYWLTEIGPLNRLRHLWVYSDLDERSSKRAVFMADKEWTEDFLPRGMALILRQATQLIEPKEMSASFKNVVNSAKPHGPHESEPLREGWAALHTQPLESGFFTGSIIAGEQVGQTISVAPAARTPALELMRPCAFSPL